MRHLRNALTGTIVASTILLSYTLYRSVSERKQLRSDQAEITHITYGLFDPSEWKHVISQILRSKVMRFELAGADREQVRIRTIDLMNGLLTEVEGVLRRKNQEKGLSGSLKNALFNLIVDMDAIRSGVPRYADMIVDYANEPANRRELQCFAIDKLNEVGNTTEGMVDRRLLHAALSRYECTERSEALTIIQARINVIDRKLRDTFIAFGAACAALLVLAFTATTGSRAPLICIIAVGICSLFLGLQLPMIDIEARIATFELFLLGEPVTFTDQTLFHQSKSILQVVRLLLAESKPALMAVAVAVFTFSVLLPTTKMLLSFITLIRRRELPGRLAGFLVHRSGKWSMADVMVVAIFMAFIGFNGVVDGQLSSLEDYANAAHVLTTNNSNLESGFYLFTLYCLIGLITSALLPRTLEASVKAKGTCSR